MATTDKKYLDLAGLTQYDGKIKALINNQDVKKVAINASSVVLNEKTYAAGNVLLVWIGWGGATSSEDKAAYLANEANATYKIPMGGAALKALIGDYTAGTLTADDTTTTFAHGDITEYIGAVKSLAAKNLELAIDGLDATEAPIAAVNNNVVTIHGVKQENGVVGVGTNAANDIVLEEVAYTGAAADVSTAAIDDGDATDPTSLYAAGTVQGTLEAIARDLNDLTSESAVTVEKQTTAETGYFATYVIKQNNTQVGEKINIPKDFLVKAAEVKTVATADDPYSGAAVGDKYIDFTVNTRDASETNEHLYIPVNDLMQALTVEQNATEVQLALSSSNVLSASIIDVDAADVNYAGGSETVEQALTRLDGNDSTTGSVAKAVKDGIEALDVVSPIAFASVDSTTGVVTINCGQG